MEQDTVDLPSEIEYLGQFITDNKKERIADVLSRRTRHIVVGLEDIFQPQNASAVLRTCDCFGVQEAHIIENRNKYTVNRDVTQGAHKWVDRIMYNEGDFNTVSCVDSLKAKGYKVVATTLRNHNCTLEEVPVDEKLAVFFGSEDPGLTDEVLERSDYRAFIPMQGFSQSFNISVSAALTLYSLTTRMRQDPSIKWQLSQLEIDELTWRWYRKVTRL